MCVHAILLCVPMRTVSPSCCVYAHCVSLMSCLCALCLPHVVSMRTVSPSCCVYAYCVSLMSCLCQWAAPMLSIGQAGWSYGAWVVSPPSSLHRVHTLRYGIIAQYRSVWPSQPAIGIRHDTHYTCQYLKKCYLLPCSICIHTDNTYNLLQMNSIRQPRIKLKHTRKYILH